MTGRYVPVYGLRTVDPVLEREAETAIVNFQPVVRVKVSGTYLRVEERRPRYRLRRVSARVRE